jgi:hypothetical protein
MGLSFTIAAFLTSAVILGFESRILLPQIRGSPNLEGHVPMFIYHRNRLTQLYPEVLGSLSDASYDSQGCGGSIRPRLHTGLGFEILIVVLM